MPIASRTTRALLRRRLLAVPLAWLVASAAGPAPAQEPEVIGFLKVVEGDVRVLTAGGEEMGRPGTALHVGSTIVTGANGSAGLTLKDNTLLSLGPGSRLSIDEYRFAPASGLLGLVATISKGTLEYVSGVIAKLRPGSVSIRTPTGTIGVRGTRFLVRVDD